MQTPKGMMYWRRRRREGGKTTQKQGAENKIKEACILYTTVGLSHSTQRKLAAGKSIASTEALSVYLKH